MAKPWPTSPGEAAAIPAPAGRLRVHRRSACSATATISVPARANSAAACMLSGPFPEKITRRPGAVWLERNRDWAAPVVITPGRVHPGMGTAFSRAPAASTSRCGRKVHAAPRPWANSRSGRNAPHTFTPLMTRTPARSARARSSLPRRNWESKRASSIRQAGEGCL